MSAAAEVEAELRALGAEATFVFDAHSHTGTDLDGSGRSCEEHALELERLGGRSVIFPFHVAGDYAPENRRVIEEAARHPDRLVAFARLDPRACTAAEAAAALAAGARGFKLHPRAEEFPIGHPGVDTILGVAAEAEVPVLIHAGTGVGSFGPLLLELAERHRGSPLILAHAGISDLAWLWPHVPGHPNLFFDTAWLVPADLLALFALVPPGRILFGSDAPYMDAALLRAVTLRCARFSGLGTDAVGLVMGAQLENLLAAVPAADAGPPPGPAAPGLPPERARVASLLSAVGGCALGGGDPSRPLELALLALQGPGFGDIEGQRLAALIEQARGPAPEAVQALVLALALAMTPGVGAEALLA